MSSTAASEVTVTMSAPQLDIYGSQAARNLYQAGQGSGKTRVMGYVSYNLIISCKDAVGLIAANTYGQLSDSTLLEITHVWHDLGLTEYDKTSNPHGFYIIDKEPPSSFVPHGHVFKTNMNKIFFRNGAVVMLASLDNYKSIEGRTIGWALLDETSDTREVAVTEVITGRLRGEGIHVNTNKATRHTMPFVPKDHPDAGDQRNPLYVFTKPAKEQWLTEMFSLEDHREEIEAHIYSKTDYFYKIYAGKCVVISSAYHNKFLPKGYIESRLSELGKDQIDMLIYGSPFGKSGVEYYSAFTRTKHVKNLAHDRSLALHFTLDFNVNPYMPAQVWQVEYGQRIEVRCIREYAMQSPNSTIEAVCDAFRREFGDYCSPGLFYYGDATGKARLPVAEARDFYKVVEKNLFGLVYNTSRRLLKQNPRHKSIGHGTLGRREFMNGILNGAFGIDVVIDESCKHTIADFEFCKEDANGAKLKAIEVINGVSCQKYGHMSDAADALICYLFGEYEKEKENDKVRTGRAA